MNKVTLSVLDKSEGVPLKDCGRLCFEFDLVCLALEKLRIGSCFMRLPVACYLNARGRLSLRRQLGLAVSQI